MDLPLFYAPPEKIRENLITLGKAELHHATRVMRLEKDAPVIVVDDLGMAYRGELVSRSENSPHHVQAHATVRRMGEPMVSLTLAIGLSTGYKFDTVIQKGTEIGVSRFVPLVTEKSQVKPTDDRRMKARLKRYQKVALAAMKQARRSVCPEIAPPVNLDSFLNDFKGDDLNLIFHPAVGNVSLSSRIDQIQGPHSVCVMVGAESGFSEGEIKKAEMAGFLTVSLGSRILRTETAGPVISALVLHYLGEME